ncbi:ABC transporter permease [Labilibacter marinus]|uniref:ABC transporter permease n=1 Tax=Labilibacter marinus TaxID=1477105 RepID=UPI00094F9D96|nr:ABC transporter permease [Labilibacter marinus]
MNLLRNINLRIIIRNLLRNKLHSSINIIGFAIGIAVFILIVRYTDHQFSYDGFHQQHNNIYKIHLGESRSIPSATAQFLKDNIAGIEDVVRLDEWYGGGSEGYLKKGTETFKTTDFIFTDPSFFNFFDFKLLYGDVNNALGTPNSIILSEHLAKKIFGDQNPTGKQIEYLSNYPSASYRFTIKGVIKDAPSNSSIQYNGLVSMSTIPYHNIRNGNISEDWSNWGFGTYVKISNAKLAKQLNTESPEFWNKRVLERWQADKGSPRAKEYKLTFVPFKEVHFASGTKRSSVYLILLIGIIILVIAIINYINLSLAISTTRIKEIGIRKVIGSRKSTLFYQFIFESILLTTTAAILALSISYLLHPFLYDFTGFETIMESGKIFIAVLTLMAGVITIGILAGIYPAWILTNMAPVQSLKKEFHKGKRGNTLKHVLIVSQFVVSIFLVISVIVVTKQVDFMKSKELGFNKEHIINLSGGSSINNEYKAFRESLLKNPTIKNVARSNGIFVRNLNITSKHKVNDEFRTYRATTIDPDFIETYGFELIEGRNFSWKIKSDLNNTALVNECFVKKMELENPVGSVVKFLDNDITIIGVVKDFHINSLHSKIEPSMLAYLPWNSCINIKISGTDINNTITTIESTWKDFSPNVPFEYQFLDKEFEALYSSEVEFSSLIRIFTLIAVFIACLGLFGLISFSAIQRRKEIGIRKVNGAKIHEVLATLNIDVIKWVGIAFLISCPISYYAMNKWLESFAYKTELSWWIFALAGVLAVGIALLTVSWQSWRAATRNPVEALRHE